MLTHIDYHIWCGSPLRWLFLTCCVQHYLLFVFDMFQCLQLLKLCLWFFPFTQPFPLHNQLSSNHMYHSPYRVIQWPQLLFHSLCLSSHLRLFLPPLHSTWWPASFVFRSRIREESLAFEAMLRAAADIANRLEISSQALHASFTKQLKDVGKIHR